MPTPCEECVRNRLATVAWTSSYGVTDLLQILDGLSIGIVVSS